MAETRSAHKREALNLRIRPEERGLIDRAAKSLGVTRTAFVLDAARRAAQETMLDRTLFAVDSGAYREFLDRLDQPPRPNARLRRTMSMPAPWD